MANSRIGMVESEQLRLHRSFSSWESSSFTIDRIGKSLDLPEFSDGLVFHLNKTADLQQLIAYAGVDELIGLGQSLNLDASNSSIPQLAATQIQWTIIEQPDSSLAQINAANSLQAEITPDFPGAYIIQLSLNQLDGSIAQDTLEILVSDIPVAVAGMDQSIFPGERANLSGRESFDRENDRLTYQWALISQPNGSQPDFRFTNSSRPIFVPDSLGTYLLSLTVNDGLSNSIPDTVKISVIDPLISSSKQILAAGMDISPNPSSGSFILSFGEGFKANIMLKIYNPIGQLQLQKVISEQRVEINLGNKVVIDGLYLLKVERPDGKYWIQRILIQN